MTTLSFTAQRDHDLLLIAATKGATELATMPLVESVCRTIKASVEGMDVITRETIATIVRNYLTDVATWRFRPARCVVVELETLVEILERIGK